MTLCERIEVLAATWEARAYEHEALASPERASSLEDQVEHRREAGRLRLQIKELRDAIDGEAANSHSHPQP